MKAIIDIGLALFFVDIGFLIGVVTVALHSGEGPDDQ